MRLIIKISGEALAGNKERYDNVVLNGIAEQILKLKEQKHEISLVMGGGNLFRGKDLIKEAKIDRSTADYIGMLATIQNSLIVRDFLLSKNIPAIVSTAISMNKVAEPYIPQKLKKRLSDGYIVILAGGLGLPYFSTDTAITQRTLETNSDYLIMTKNNVDGIYDEDPKHNSNAKKFDKITTKEILQRELGFADHTSIALMKEHKIKAKVVDLKDLYRALDKNVGTEIDTN